MPSPMISSPSNQFIKDMVRLKNRKGDRSQRSFIVEGAREIARAGEKSFFLEELLVCSELLTDLSRSLVSKYSAKNVITVSTEAFSKVAVRDTSDGILGVFKQQEFSLQDVLGRAGQQSPFIVVLENVEKPGNLGAILRSADGSGVHGVVILGDKVDVWNPNVIRSSVGGVFSVPTIHFDDAEIFLTWCRQHRIKTVAAALNPNSKPIYEENFKEPLAIMFGSESHGLSSTLVSQVDKSVLIPMQGICDSLNVSVAAGIFMYEVQRQRLLS